MVLEPKCLYPNVQTVNIAVDSGSSPHSACNESAQKKKAFAKKAFIYHM